MKLTITAKHVELPSALKQHIEEKIEKLDKFQIKIVEAHMVLTKEKYLYVAEIKVLAKRLQLFIKENAETNFYEAVDKVIHKMEVQLGKHKDKIKGHHQGRQAASAITAFEEEEQQIRNLFT